MLKKLRLSPFAEPLRQQWRCGSHFPLVLSAVGVRGAGRNVCPTCSPQRRRQDAARGGERSSSCPEGHDALGTDAAGRFFFVDVAPLGVAHPGGGPLSSADAGALPWRPPWLSVWLTMTQLGFRTSRAELLSPNERLQPPLARIHQGVRRQGGRGRRRRRRRAASRSPPP